MYDPIKPTRALVETSSAILQSIMEADGEITPEINAEISSLELQKPDRVDLAIELIGRSKAEAAFWKEKAEGYYKMAASFESLEEKIRAGVKMVMFEGGHTELFGIYHRFRMAEIKPTLKVNEEELPAEYLKEKTTLVPDSDKIREALTSGKTVRGAKLVSNFRLSHHKNREPLREVAFGIQQKEAM